MRGRLLALAFAALATAVAGGEKAPRVRVEPEGFDFGRALPGKTLRKEFRVRNFGDAPLVIEGVSTSCGCTAAIASESRIEPGGSTVLRVTLETRRYSGRVEREVLLRSNDPKAPRIAVRVSATVEAAKPR